jgi:thiol:disulfide interchange protein DsbD
MTAALTGSLFGAALQQPAVLGGVALVLVLLAASNFGLYTLQLPPALAQRLGRVGEGAVGAFFMGLTMGLVAAPCVGPLIVALLVFVGSQQSVALGFALFFALGLGMGAPYVLLAALAGRMRRLPRGGGWLLWVEHVLASCSSGWRCGSRLRCCRRRGHGSRRPRCSSPPRSVLGFRAADGGVAFRWARRALGVALVGLALGGLFEADAQSPIPWQPFSDEAFDACRSPSAGTCSSTSRRTGASPAAEMDRTTFRDPDVVAPLSRSSRSRST